MIRVLIIDDEKLARDVIKAYVNQHPDMQVVGECTNGFEGVKNIHQIKPDLLFLDIQMPKLSGFEMLELIDEKPAVIFSTAFDQYAIKAFEENAIDYLLKPYSQARFDEALDKARQKMEYGQSGMDIDQVVAHKQQTTIPIERVVVRVGSKIVIIPISKIEFIAAQDDYVEINSDGKKYLKQVTMKFLGNALPKDKFVRVHRSFIVAINQIDRLEAYSKDSYLAKLKTGQQISVSRAGYALLKDVLEF